ncbi:hypothetical protein [Jannaschia sp. 2305UL9-9]|uniref:protein-tyrosine phosphatase family protein n=1 Tax=Jannaschia sp. 2305UL9-9 TaxID=3121638 RepID=UPI00352775CB
MVRGAFGIPTRGPGQLFIGPCPDPGALSDAVHALADDGITTVISLLTPEDVQTLGLEREEAHCAARGMAFVAAPIRDFGLPSADQVTWLQSLIGGRLDAGDAVFVHCKAGIGRSGITACAVLVDRGHTPEAALKIVSAARGRPVPDTPEQRRFVLSLG